MHDNTVKDLRTIRRISYVVASLPFLAAATMLYQGPPIWAFILMACVLALTLFFIGAIIAVERLMQRVKTLEQFQQASARLSNPEG